MRTTLKMPKVGDAVEEVVIVDIPISVGDQLTEGQTMFVVETDKSQVEVPAPGAGKVVEIKFAVGDVIKNGAPTITLEV